MSLDRRSLVAAGSAALGATLLPGPFWAAPSSVPPAPTARVAVARDTYFGETLSDPYRWMEDDKDTDWIPFLKGQNAHARGVLDAIPGRDALLARIQQLSGDTVATSAVQRAGGKTFFEQRPVGADSSKLFVREGAAERLLIDPRRLDGPSGHVSLDWWRVSPDGSHLVYGLSRNGSEDSILRVMSVADGRDLPETITDTQFAQPSWLDDGSGFFYTRLTGVVGTPERFLDAQARFHRLGADPSLDPIVMRRGQDPAVAFDRIQVPGITTFRGADRALLILADVRPERRILVAPLADVLAGRARWIPVADFDDEVTDAEIDGETLFLLANRGAPRGRVLATRVAAPDLASAHQVVAEGPRAIENLARARDGLFLTIMDGGVSRLQRLDHDRRLSEIALPFEGSIGAVFATPEEDGAMLLLSGWLTPTGVWRVDGAGNVSDTGLTPRPPIDLAPYESVRLFATARDGTQVPYSLIHKRGLKRDGATPAFISAYGSYGISYTPEFSPRTLALIDAGFIVGYANVRGGGEYGRPWHKAGQLANKPNTWRDLIDVCEDVCARRYTVPARLTIGGRSAGGITVGRALTERPDLFAAVIDGVGWSNPLRYVAEPNGYGEEPEWGVITAPSGYRALKGIDSYQAVRDGVAYPAVLLTTGVNDPRVAPFHAAKMTARLQAATRSGNPILLRVEFEAGHGIGSTRAQVDREMADTFAFLLWRTGVPGFQPA